MKIIPLTNNDIDQCAKLYIKAYNRPPWNYSWDFDKAIDYLSEYFERKRFVGFVLLEDDQIVGAMLGHSKTWWTSDLLYVDELFISPDAQGRGYGKLLLDHTEQYAIEQGYEVITLMTSKYMPAFKFYKKIDYIQAEHYVFFFKPLSK
jgi:aminoglycoside 6'-N-acetyltransferase I